MGTGRSVSLPSFEFLVTTILKRPKKFFGGGNELQSPLEQDLGSDSPRDQHHWFPLFFAEQLTRPLHQYHLKGGKDSEVTWT